MALKTNKNEIQQRWDPSNTAETVSTVNQELNGDLIESFGKILMSLRLINGSDLALAFLNAAAKYA